MRLLAMVAALTLAVSAPVAGAPSLAVSGDGALLPRVLTVVLGLTAAALAARAIRRTRPKPPDPKPPDPERSRSRRR